MESVDAVLKKDADSLRELIGSKLTDVWLAWHTDHDEWFSDEAVVFRFGQRQLEACHIQISQLLITWNTVDLEQPPSWLGCYGEMPLVWQKDRHPSIVPALNATLEDIAMVEYLPQAPANSRELLYALEFKFDSGSLSMYNALDENGLKSEPLSGPEYRKHWIAGGVERQ